jgi:pimeloyl-ACP methyl ester carboxylesterase
MPPVNGSRETLTTVLRAADGVAISAHHDPPHVPDAGMAFVVAHGFTGSWRKPEIRAVVDVLRRRGGVVSLDLRGHGTSGGLSTLGDAEVLDVDAAVAWARALGYPRVVTVGWSMGAAVVIRHAALWRGVDAVVAASGPSRWHYQGTRPMRTVHRAVRTRLGRWALATWYGTRVGRFPSAPPPEPPDAVAGRIAPTPLLVVHGDADHYFPLEHAQWLALAAGPTAELWIEHGFTHADRGAAPELVARMADWAVAARASAKMPG